MLKNFLKNRKTTTGFQEQPDTMRDYVVKNYNLNKGFAPSYVH